MIITALQYKNIPIDYFLHYGDLMLLVDLRYQPVYSQNFVIQFYEILSSFKDKQSYEKLNTQDTILDFETTDTIIQYDFFVLAKIVNQIKIDRSNGINRIYSVNLSAKTIFKHNQIKRLIGDVAQSLILEITETCKVDTFKSVNIFCKSMHYAGAKIAIDDINNTKQWFNLISFSTPDYVKLSLPLDKNIDKVDQAFRIAEISKKIHTNTTIVFENIEDTFQFIEIHRRFPKALVQGYLFNKSESLIEGLVYNYH